MKFLIDGKKEIKHRPLPYYRLTIDFMIGDADGKETKVLEIEPGELGNHEGLILALECCNAAYARGMGGYDTYHGLPEYDAFFVEDVNYDAYDNLNEGDLPEDEFKDSITRMLEDLNPEGIIVIHPEGPEGMTTSFDGYQLEYIDINGDIYTMSITLNEEEKSRVKEVSKFEGVNY
jgi:hypothetical protein